MKITIDQPTCQAYGLCVMEAPEFFEIDEDADKVVLLREDAVTTEELGAVEAAGRACPVLAITVGGRKTTNGEQAR